MNFSEIIRREKQKYSKMNRVLMVLRQSEVYQRKAVKKEKRVRLPKGFLSSKGVPTKNAIDAYMIYMKNLPEGWNINVVHEESAQKVRDHFGWNNSNGFGMMMIWGIRAKASTSRTSYERARAMSIAYHEAKSLMANDIIRAPILIDR
jgi:hypothetical protein